MEVRTTISFELDHLFVVRKVKELLGKNGLHLRKPEVLDKINLAKEYQDDGKKTTRILARLLEEACIPYEGTEEIDAKKALSRVLGELGKLYQKASQIDMVIKLLPVYEAYRRGVVGDYGDKDSCLRVGGCNEGHAFFLAHGGRDWEAFYVMLETSGHFYGKARCWLLLHEKVAWLCNIYSKGFLSNYSKQELLNVVGNALLKCFGFARTSWGDPFQNGGRAPIYWNGDEIFLLPDEGEEIPSESPFRKAKCPTCGTYTRLETEENVEVPRYAMVKGFDPLEIWGTYIRNVPLCNSCIYDYGGGYSCTRCGCGLHEDEAHWYDGEPYCSDCFFERYDYCANCDEATPNEEMWYIHGLGYVCNYCTNRLLDRGVAYECIECRETFHESQYPSNYIRFEGEEVDDYICPSCFHRLREARVIVWNDDIQSYKYIG